MTTNEPAFPRPHTTADANSPYFKIGHEGMTLRDYFAAKAMPVILANPRNLSYLEVAECSYQMADAMLTVRNMK